MKKIVIMNGPSKQNDLLMACLHILFPECEIQVQSKEMRIAEEVHTVSDSLPRKVITAGKLCEDKGKFFSHEQ